MRQKQRPEKVRKESVSTRWVKILACCPRETNVWSDSTLLCIPHGFVAPLTLNYRFHWLHFPPSRWTSVISLNDCHPAWGLYDKFSFGIRESKTVVGTFLPAEWINKKENKGKKKWGKKRKNCIEATPPTHQTLQLDGPTIWITGLQEHLASLGSSCWATEAK